MGSNTHSAVLGRGGRDTSRARLSSIILASFFTSVFWWLFFLFPSDIISLTRKTTKTLSCGNSTADAKARGCQFDVLSFLWVPEPCFDAETAAAYQRAVNWHGYNDAEGKEMLDLAAMAERVEPGKYYTTAKEHAVHCAYVWQKQHKGYLKGGLYLDDNSASFHHTRHCSEVLMYTAELEPEKLASFTTETTVGFSSCLVEL
ncbi:hypothetical protein LEL_04676 [Akanthomyces lecanii RCEF 1005]|uniref:Uncharacterized protein n=1 Tax=Akanthomyces lecanii RCEF 1005 TaxID=1081108 RepID=A0A162K704_CORDF|nr:hypothetical protein LEL_04676 [Akanthomyces lecanii RCEF 1005]